MLKDLSPDDLSSGEKHSAVWRKLEEHLQSRLNQCRLLLEGSLNLDETNRIRGRIIELKNLLRLGEDKPNVE